MGDNNKMICRVCEATEDLCDLFAKENEDLLVMLESVANIYLNKDDILPNQICSSCIIRLQDAHQFKELCQATECKLRDKFYSIEKDRLTIDEIVIVEYIQDDDIVSIKSEEGRAEKDTQRREVELTIELNTQEVLSDREQSREQSFDKSDRLDPVDTFDTTDLQSDWESGKESSNTKDEETTLNHNYVGNKSKMTRKRKKFDRRQKVPKNDVKTERVKPKMEFQCHFCSEIILHRIKFEQHVLEVHNKKPYPCTKCPKEFRRPSHLESHVMVHSEGERSLLACELCNRKYTIERNLIRHIRVAHQNIKNYVCEVCGKRFSRREQIDQHKLRHIAEKNYACDGCERKFKTEKQLLSHKVVHEPDFKPPVNQTKTGLYQCPDCGKYLTYKAALQTHKRMHAGDRHYACTFEGCDKRYFSVAALISHKHRHSDARPYVCLVCGKSFRQWAHLKCHKRLHSDNLKPYECEICSNKYATKPSLQIHRRVHTGERPFQCTICNTRFMDKAVLKKHKLIHGVENIPEKLIEQNN